MLVIFTQCQDSLTSTNDPSDNEEELPVPQLISPTNNSTNQSLQVDLNWKRIKGAKDYKIQLSKSDDFESTLLDSMIEGSSFTKPPLDAETTYFWRVKPFKKNHEGPWSETWQFSTSSSDIEPVTVELQSPDDDTVLNTEIPKFEWSAVSESADYHFQLAQDENFNDLVKDSVVAASDVAVVLSGADGIYHWRVAPIVDSAPTEWSEVFDFTKEVPSSDSTDLTAPVQTSPNDGATEVALQPTFEWEKVDGAEYYILHANSIDPSEMVIETEVEGTTFSPEADLATQTSHDWRVRAVAGDTQGDWSEIHRFTTGSGGSDGSGSSSVSLNSPSDGSSYQPVNLTLDWETVSGASDYQIQLAANSSFSSPVIDETVTESTYDASGLDYSQTYYWRVQVNGDGDSGNWSTVYSFTTESESTAPVEGSQSGDEAALEALYQSAGGSGWSNRAGWSSSGMSLGDNIYGVTVESIDGELRVTQLDLHNNGLSGSIDVPELGNLTQMRLFSVAFNSLNSQLPAELGNATNLKYLYLSYSDDVVPKNEHPHEYVQAPGGYTYDFHPGKDKGSERNIFTGAVPSNWGNLSNLKWLVLNWTDSAKGAFDGISSVPVELFDIQSFEGLNIHNNNNVADLPFPKGITDMNNLKHLALGVGKSSHNNHGWVTGSLPAGFGNLSNLKMVRLNENGNLTIDFDQVDFSGMTSLVKFTAPFTNTRGSFPQEFMDGTLPDFKTFNIGFSLDNTGVTGSFPTQVKSGMQVVNVSYWNSMEGAIPAQLWQNSTGIIQAEFGGNNFTSMGTTDLTGQRKLRNLLVQDNNIGPENWPNLAWGTDRVKDLSRVNFSGNRYVFKNMLWKPSNGGGKTIFQLYQGLGLTIFKYGSQQPFGQSRTINLSTGSTITIDDFADVVGHSDNRYQWQKDGVDISGATSRSLTITDAQSSDAGTYRLVVTNPGVSGLTLKSQPIELK